MALPDYGDGGVQADWPSVVTLGNEVTYTAKKTHRCNICSRPITPGQRYRRQVLLVDGEFTVEKCHDYHNVSMGE